MTREELALQVAHIRLSVKRLLEGSLAGDFVTALKGSGLEFSQIRAYVPGDDVRAIDWKSSARQKNLMVKEYMQEKERTVIIVLDASVTMGIAHREVSKYRQAQRVAASLALIAAHTNDKVGLLIAGRESVFYPPRKGMRATAQLLEKIFMHECERSPARSREQVVADLMRNRVRAAVICWISDWIGEDTMETQALLSLVGRRNEAIAIRVYEPLERAFPVCGVVTLSDGIDGSEVVITASGAERVRINAALSERALRQRRMLESRRFAVLDMSTEHSSSDALAAFFYKRAH